MIPTELVMDNSDGKTRPAVVLSEPLGSSGYVRLAVFYKQGLKLCMGCRWSDGHISVGFGFNLTKPEMEILRTLLNKEAASKS